MPNLLVCMTPGVGLHTWEKIGILQRELKPYVEYVRKGWNVKILTFDKDRVPELPEGIEAVRFPDRKLLWLLPWIHKKTGAWADMIKTNQSVHAYFYTNAARNWNKPMLLRCGYVHGEFLESTMRSGLKVRLYHLMEKNAFRNSAHCEVPTEYLSGWVSNNYGIPGKRISIVPNFVDTDIFRPVNNINRTEASIVSVGRLTPVKRFDLLINACAEIPGCKLTIIGEGPERTRLQQLAKSRDINLNLPGNVPNNVLPQVIREHTVFAIVSSWEGHPKALIEAMSCGMPCIGAEAPGILDTITHDKNGLLVKPSLTSLVEGLKELLQNQELRAKLSKEARKHIENNYSFMQCFTREYNIVQRLLSRSGN